jgi:hypothetical protein
MEPLFGCVANGRYSSAILRTTPAVAFNFGKRVAAYKPFPPKSEDGPVCISRVHTSISLLSQPNLCTTPSSIPTTTLRLGIQGSTHCSKAVKPRPKNGYHLIRRTWSSHHITVSSSQVCITLRLGPLPSPDHPALCRRGQDFERSNDNLGARSRLFCKVSGVLDSVYEWFS